MGGGGMCVTIAIGSAMAIRRPTVMNEGPVSGEAVETEERLKAKKPFLYRVFLLNDDYTTMDFVVFVLEKVFRKSPAEAMQIMLHVHQKGIGLAGVYTREIAETKVTEVYELARDSEFPLKCIMEKE
jgi:ATP-dependent Clp protease adaptor protein ClpS